MVVAVLVGGCAGDDSALFGATDDYIDQDVPPGNCSAGTSAQPCPDPDSSGSPEGGACLESEHCADGNACVAPFEGGEVGPFTCTSQCIPIEDEGAWCLDDLACCEPTAVCNARGLCVVPGGVDESGTAGEGTSEDGGGSTAGGDTEGSDTAGSDTEGSDTEGSSSSGAAPGTTGMQ